MRRYVVTAAVACLLLGGTLAATLRPHGAAAQSPKRPAARTDTLAATARLDPAHVAALHKPETAVPGVPELTRMIGGGATPAPGAAHRIGPRGITLAWINDGAICEVQDYGGGCVPPIDAPIAVTIADPDVVGEGQPERVIGLAADGVVEIEARLADGRTLSAKPVDNFYEIRLPAGVTPAVAITVRAILADGSTYTEHMLGTP